MTESIRFRVESFREISEDEVRMLSAGVARSKELEEQVKHLTTLVMSITAKIEEDKSERADLQQKTQDLQQQIQEITENAAAETKARLIETAQLRKELDYFKNKFHLSQLRNFWQKFLHAVLADLGFESEEIDHASTGELWNMLNDERYTLWRAALEVRKQLPTYAQMANAAVHTSQMMELFDELNITGPNTEMYQPMWDYLATKSAWKHWSPLVEA